jgi:protein kinase C substrate 80K-H
MDQCYDYEEREYTYRICMFKDAKQISKGGGSDVNIGYWDSWCGPENNKYLKMKYANGATCWNGPARSLTVTFRCGLEHKPIDVREPSRCEYAMIFETPSACDEALATTNLHPDHVEF